MLFKALGLLSLVSLVKSESNDYSIQEYNDYSQSDEVSKDYSNDYSYDYSNDDDEALRFMWNPLFRYWKAAGGDHFYTTNAAEIGTTTPGRVGRYGYKSEGYTGFVARVRAPRTVPLFRYWNAGNTDHFYTTNAGEIGTTTPGRVGRFGYKSEGVAGYCYPRRYYRDTVPLYRYWNPGNGDHFYTTNSREIGTTRPGTTGRHGYKSEGVACYVRVRRPRGGGPKSPPRPPARNPWQTFYRYWNAGAKDHFYTRNAREIGTTRPGTVGRYGYKSEGNVGRIADRKVAGTVPLFRYWNAGAKDHFYTTNAGEIGTTRPGAVGKYGYKSEGVAGYCYSRRVGGTRPLYRYWHAGAKDHFYTLNAREIGTIRPGAVGRYGYRSEGVACYVR